MGGPSSAPHDQMAMYFSCLVFDEEEVHNSGIKEISDEGISDDITGGIDN